MGTTRRYTTRSAHERWQWQRDGPNDTSLARFVGIFIDAQAAITRMTHDEPGPGQTYAIQARQAIAILRKQEPAVEIEINWCPAHKGIPGNEVADEWAKLAASEPDEHGVEWLTLADGTRAPQRATSLAHLRRMVSEKKWPEV